MSNAWRVLVDDGSLPASLVSRRIPNTGTSNTSIRASDAAASGHGCACTVSLHSRHRDLGTAPSAGPPSCAPSAGPPSCAPSAGPPSCLPSARTPSSRAAGALPSCAGRALARPAFEPRRCRRSTTRSPKRESIAGSTVNEASRVNRTARTDAIESPYMNGTAVANMPSSAITTVVPASRIALPEVSIACSTDASTSPSARNDSRKRVTMNSA